MNNKSGVYLFRVMFLMANALVLSGCINEPAETETAEPAVQSTLVYEEDGALQYAAWNDRGDTVPDFSYCGYRGGGVALPDAPVKVTLSPSSTGDDTQQIQDALDQVGAMSVGSEGIRGAVLLQKGDYRVSDTITLRHSGVVLRGSGSEADGTKIIAVKPEKHSVFKIEGGGAYVVSSRTEIADAYVPVGARTFRLEEAGAFQPGDSVLLFRHANKKWLADLGNAPKWTASQYTYRYERTVVAVEDDQITVDVPLVEAIDRQYGGGSLAQYKFPNRIEQAGIESLCIESAYDISVMRPLTGTDTPDKRNAVSDFGWMGMEPVSYPSDENHAWEGISINNAQDIWVRDVSSYYLGYGLVNIVKFAKRVTVQDCSVYDPVSIIQGGRRYSYAIYGQQNLVQRCYSRGGRHDFVVQFRSHGPNVFFGCKAEESLNFNETHLCWSTGVLYDGVSVEGPFGFLSTVWRGGVAPGHGWSGANVFFWNCRAALVFAQDPPTTAQNFVIGLDGIDNAYRSNIVARSQNLFRKFNTDREQFDVQGGGHVMGDGWIEFPEQSVSPRSLYLRQLQERLGPDALKNIGW